MKNKKNHKAASEFQVNENVSLEEQIAQRAHELWQQRAHKHGSDMEDWLQAESQINEWHQQRCKTSITGDSQRAST